MIVIAPTDNRTTYAKDAAERRKAYNVSRKAFLNFSNAILDEKCPGWEKWLKWSESYAGYSNGVIAQVLKDIENYKGRGTFRRIKSGEAFTLSAKHIEKINAFIAEKEEAEQRRENNRNALTNLKNIVRPVLVKYKDRFHLERSTVSLSGIELRLDEGVTININHLGEISEPHTDRTFVSSVSEAQSFMEKYRPHFDEIAKLANEIKADLPPEYFEYAKQGAPVIGIGGKE